MIKRHLEDIIPQFMFRGKAIIIFGPRQAGKSTLVQRITENSGRKTLYLSGDDFNVKEWFKEPYREKPAGISAGYGILVIDEAQKIDDIGNLIKIFIDQIKEVQVIATGAFAFELMSKTSESLTGRKFEFMLYPLSFAELVNHSDIITEKGSLDERLIKGSYPEVVSIPEFSVRTLKALVTDYLFKDVFTINGLRYPSVIESLVRAIAFQVGSAVNTSVLTKTDSKTIEKYLCIMDQAYIIFRLPAPSRNGSTEIKKGKKYYFYDNGIRNALIGNFSDIKSLTDAGALRENYIISERYKYLSYNESTARTFIRRTVQQQEIDYLEETYSGIRAFEFNGIKIPASGSRKLLLITILRSLFLWLPGEITKSF